MKLHCISEHDYNEMVFKLIFSRCGFSSSLGVSEAGYPTIGYNFNLQDDKTLIPVLGSLGFDVHANNLEGAALEAEQYYIDLIRSALKIFNSKDADSLNNIIQSILAARLMDKRYAECGKYKRIARFVYENEASFVACLSAVIKNYEKSIDQWLMSFDMEIVNQNPQLLARKTRERAVLLSLAYQGFIGLKSNNSPLFPALGNALLMDDRALVWYYIRYYAFSEDVNCGQEKDINTVKRRYYESELFGLYDEGVTEDNITTEQCKEVYNMFHEYKEIIINHERCYNARIAEANQLFGLTGASAIKTLEQSFAMAYNHIRSAKLVSSLPAKDLNPQLPEKPPVLKPWQPQEREKSAPHLVRALAG